MSAAAEEFNSAGYYGTDSNRIARAAGYAPGTFYKHFKDKKAIFLAAYTHWVLAELGDIRGLVEGKALTKRDFEMVVETVVEHHRRWRDFRRSLRALAATDAEVHAVQLEQREAWLGFMAELGRAGSTPRRRRSANLLILLAFERMCDAIADGDLEELSIPEREVTRRLEDLLRG